MQSTLDQSLWHAMTGREILCAIDSADYRRRAVIYKKTKGSRHDQKCIYVIYSINSVMIVDTRIKGGFPCAIKQGTKFVQAPEWTVDDTRALFS
jgi:hypothetical protein